MSDWNFGEKLKRLRIEKGLTQTDLAKRMGLSNRSSITHIEKGRQKPTTEVIERLAKALGVSPAEFFFEPKNDVSDMIPYLENADESILKAIRKLLDMPEK